MPAFAALAAGTLNRDSYVALLGRLLGFHAPMEQALAPPLRHIVAADAWQRAHLLRTDLAAFGLRERDMAALPTIEPPLTLTEPSAMGCLYVIEGSTLGGRHLARQLGDVVPGGGEAGRRFLRAGEQPGRMRWGAFCSMLDEVGAEPGRRSAMIAGALDTFARFEMWFSRALQT